MIVRWTKKLGVWGWIFFAVGGFSLTLVLVVVGSIYWQSKRVERMLAGIRAAGEPVTVAEFEAMLPPIPAEEDATQLWLDGFAVNGPIDQTRFAKLPFVGAERPLEPPLPGSDWPELALAEEYLVDHAEALELFHEAAALGGAAHLFPIHDPTSFDILSWRKAARLLLVESQIHAHKGQVGPTVAALKTIFALEKASEGSPNQIASAVRLGIVLSATEQLLRLLPHVPFSDPQLARLQATLRTLDHRRELVNALLGERVFAIRALRNPSFLGRPPPDAKAAIELALMGNVAIAQFLETMSEAVAAAKLPWPEALDEAGEIEKQMLRIPFFARLEALETPLIAISFHHAAWATARTRLADLALAAHRYRLAHGRLPTALDDLAPDFLPSVPLDPYNGEPLHYLPTDDGFVVYSVGADRKDDGGRFDKAQPERADLGYRIRYSRNAPDAPIE